MREINFIIKSRAHRYIAAAKEDWLYPERYVSKSNWNNYGDGYLLMPDPRPIHYGGQVFFGYDDGSGMAFDEYGRMPGQPGYETTEQGDTKQLLYRFQGEFARRYGPKRRGRTFNMTQLDAEQDTDDFHQYHLKLDEKRRR